MASSGNPNRNAASVAALLPFERFDYKNLDNFQERFEHWVQHVRAHIDTHLSVREKYKQFYLDMAGLQLSEYTGALRYQIDKVRSTLLNLVKESKARIPDPPYNGPGAPFQPFDIMNAEDFEDRLSSWIQHVTAFIDTTNNTRERYANFAGEMSRLRLSDYSDANLIDRIVKVKRAFWAIWWESRTRHYDHSIANLPPPQNSTSTSQDCSSNEE